MGKMQAVQEMINVFVASVVSLAVLFILTRLGGKRQIAQMNLFDYVNSIGEHMCEVVNIWRPIELLHKARTIEFRLIL